jgi:hypothetical protein
LLRERVFSRPRPVHCFFPQSFPRSVEWFFKA